MEDCFFWNPQRIGQKITPLSSIIYKKTKEKAHSAGIRVSRMLARGTSIYAFDGSGEVARNAKKDIAVFTTGKECHADLSASYNISARYFIRELLKPLGEMSRLQEATQL